MEPDEITLLSIQLAGKDQQAWGRLKDTLTQRLIDVVNSLGEDRDGPSEKREQERERMLQDLMQVVTGAIQAKFERPTLENAKLRAEALDKFADAKRKFDRQETDFLLDRLEVRAAQQNLLALSLNNLRLALELLAKSNVILAVNSVDGGTAYAGPDPKMLLDLGQQ